MAALFKQHRFPYVVHLAAQAGVRHSLVDPFAYVDANLTGFATILEGCRHNGCRHLLYASSSSVYGSNTKMPFSVHDNVDHPLSLYGASKKANELMSHAYAHLYGLPMTGLRFFTVYGPWGRPDMAMWIFTKSIIAGEPIKLVQQWRYEARFHLCRRCGRADRAADRSPGGRSSRSRPASRRILVRVRRPGESTTSATTARSDCSRSWACWRRAIGKKAKRELLPMQPGDVPATYADIDELTRDVGFRPDTPIADGISRFVDWYRSYHRL